MDHLLTLLTQYGYLILFPLAVIEGPMLSVLAGLLCTMNAFNPLIAVPLIVFGDVTGDSIYYGLGRWHSTYRPPHVLSRFIPSPQKVDQVRIYFETNPIKTIFLSKVMLGIGLTGLYLAGNAKIPYQKFLLICLGTSLWQSTVYVVIGILFGTAYQRIGSLLDGFALLTILVALAVALFFVVRSRPNQP